MIRPPPVMVHSASRVPDNAVGTVSAPTSALIRTATPALAPASQQVSPAARLAAVQALDQAVVVTDADYHRLLFAWGDNVPLREDRAFAKMLCAHGAPPATSERRSSGSVPAISMNGVSR